MGRKPGGIEGRRRPSFFKVLIGDFSNQMRIPPTFVKYFGAVHSKIKLCRSAGRSWHVNVEKIGDHLFFQKGWEAFVKDNLLEDADFLVFTSAGKSKYNVKVFGINGCEKEVDMAASETHHKLSSLNGDKKQKKVTKERHDRAVPRSNAQLLHSVKSHKKVSDVGEFQVPKIEEDESDVEILAEVPLSWNTKRKAKITINLTSKIRNPSELKSSVRHTRPKDISSTGIKLHAVSEIDVDSHRPPQELQESGSGVMPTGTRLSTAEERASAFKSENPFYTVTLAPCYMTKYVHVTTDFARRYLSAYKKVTLRVSNEGTWGVKHVRTSVGTLKWRFSSGWKAFVQDNRLKAGDVCVFELIKGTGISLEVVIFRAIGDAS